MISNPTADKLSNALAGHRAEIEDAMTRYLAGPSEPTADERYAAKHLVDALIGSFNRTDRQANVPATEGVERNYYARFGDGLLPILKDVLGTETPPALLARSIDAYWRMIWARRG